MTRIEWADKTWNPVSGCTKISEGCQNCYAERMAKRLAGRCGYHENTPFQTTYHQNRIDNPQKWIKSQRVFVCSMGDLFHQDVDKKWIDSVFRRMMVWNRHTYLILTKRPDRMLDYLSGDIHCYEPHHGLFKDHGPWRGDLYPHIWFGVTAENQACADHRIPILLKINAPVRFVSVEPMLEPIDITKYLHCESCLDPAVCWCGDPKINWVICGGETGPGARPMNVRWARNLKNQCVENAVPFFFKQQAGKNKIRFLEGEIWEQFPEATS